MPTDHIDWFHQQLEASLRLLGSDAERQIEWLREAFTGQRVGDGFNVDELGEQFDDAWAGGNLDAFEALTARVQKSILRLHGALADMSGAQHTALWTVDGLRMRPEWSEVRRLASDALETLARDKRGDFDPT